MAAVIGVIDGIDQQRQVRNALLRQMLPASRGIGKAELMLGGKAAQSQDVAIGSTNPVSTWPAAALLSWALSCSRTKW